jgi:hypothetical protein
VNSIKAQAAANVQRVANSYRPIQNPRGDIFADHNSFSDLLALRVARELREAGVSTRSLRRVVEFLRTRKGLTSPLAECHLIVTGSDVLLATSREKIVSALRRPGQTAFAFVFDLGRTVEEMKQEINAPERKPPARAAVGQTVRRTVPGRAG